MFSQRFPEDSRHLQGQNIKKIVPNELASNIPRTKPHVPFQLLRSYHSISPCPRQVFIFRNEVSFYGEEFTSPRPTPSRRTTPCRLSATAYSIYLHLPFISEAVPPSEPEDAPCGGNKDPLTTDSQIYPSKILRSAHSEYLIMCFV
jgi:hypothetical protein